MVLLVCIITLPLVLYWLIKTSLKRRRTIKFLFDKTSCFISEYRKKFPKDKILVSEENLKSFFSDRIRFRKNRTRLVFTECHKYKNFFDQILKFYAEEMDTWLNPKENKKAQTSYDPNQKISSDELADIFLKNSMKEAWKQKAKKNFWSLHDLFKSLGVDVFGDEEGGLGYKAYLMLKNDPGCFPEEIFFHSV